MKREHNKKHIEQAVIERTKVCICQSFLFQILYVNKQQTALVLSGEKAVHLLFLL